MQTWASKMRINFCADPHGVTMRQHNDPDCLKSQHHVENHWHEYWQDQKFIPQWDFMSQLIFKALLGEMGSVNKKQILEAGCGTGRISLRLAQEGAKAAVFDISAAALSHAAQIFEKSNILCGASRATIFQIPYKSETFDAAWNAGVLEHFTQKERFVAMEEMARVTKKNGLVVVLNPYRWSLFYRLGKFLAEKIKRWPYGYEVPIATMKDSCPETELRLISEYSIGFFIVLLQIFRIRPDGAKIVENLSNFAFRLNAGPLGPFLGATEKLLAKIFGGYLLVSVFQKK